MISYNLFIFRHLTVPEHGIYCAQRIWGRSPGPNKRAKRTKRMHQVINRAEARRQASDARSRGIKFPIRELHAHSAVRAEMEDSNVS
jgi:hypothetical protein